MRLERRIAAFLLVLAGNQEGPKADISFEPVPIRICQASWGQPAKGERSPQEVCRR